MAELITVSQCQAVFLPKKGADLGLSDADMSMRISSCSLCMEAGNG